MKLYFTIIIVILCLAVSACSQETKKAQRPNIILIMSDDMGYSDIGCYGGDIDTPVLDALAENGLRFTQFYNTGRCCPTRASLLTGLYPHQAGIGHMMWDNQTKGYRGDLGSNTVTLAEVLKQAGYATYMSGKWHVTKYRGSEPNPPKHNWPLQRGFDKFFGTIHGAGSYYDPSSLSRNNDYVVPDDDFYYTDAISDNAVKYIEDHQGEQPFFLYLPYTAAHWPMHAKPEDIEKYKGAFDDGWDKMRVRKIDRMKGMGLIPSSLQLSEKEGVPDWQDAEMKEWYSSLMEVYAAMVDCMDQGIGRVMNSLEQKGIKDNTLVFFLQDNGGCAEQLGFKDDIRPQNKNAKSGEMQPMDPGELQTGMVPKYTRDGRPVMVGKGLMPGPDDTYLGYGRPWANASNTPFRLYKHWVHEGGIATPLIVHWPEGIEDKNEFRNEPGHLIDIMATCIEVAEASYPTKFQENEIIPLEGKSLVQVFAGKNLDERALFWEHEGNKAVRKGKYKLVSKWDKASEYNWELYDLEADRSEINNLLNTMPDKVSELESIWKQWAKRTGVRTWGTKEEILYN